jgi:hypothetical protein
MRVRRTTVAFKIICITYSECDIVALVIQHAKSMNCLAVSSMAYLAVPYFSTLSGCTIFLHIIRLYHISPHYLSLPHFYTLSRCTIFLHIICLYHISPHYLSVPYFSTLSVCTIFLHIIWLYHISPHYLAVPYFSTLSLKRHDLRGKSLLNASFEFL